jgi:hypothetical protein
MASARAATPTTSGAEPTDPARGAPNLDPPPQMLDLPVTRYVLELPPVVRMSTNEVVAWLAEALRHYLMGQPG